MALKQGKVKSSYLYLGEYNSDLEKSFALVFCMDEIYTA